VPWKVSLIPSENSFRGWLQLWDTNMKRVKVAAGIILKPVTSKKFPKPSQQVLIAKRPNEKHQGGLWEFPGGKIEANESPAQALKRELLEEIDITVIQSEFFQQIDFDYSDKNVSLLFFIVSEFSGEPKGIEGQETQWVFVNDLSRYEFPLANREIVKRLQGRVRTM